MKPVKNSEVIESWLKTVEAVNHRGSLSTDGKRLWSYRLLIGDTCNSTGVKVLKDYTASGNYGFQSQTTSCHVGLARHKADLVS